MKTLSFRSPDLRSVGDNIRVSSSYVFIRCGRKLVKLDFKDISHIESLGNYAKFHTQLGTYFTIITMKVLITKLPGKTFFQINRGTIINTTTILSFNKDAVALQNGLKFSFGEGRFKALLSFVPVL